MDGEGELQLHSERFFWRQYKEFQEFQIQTIPTCHYSASFSPLEFAS